MQSLLLCSFLVVSDINLFESSSKYSVWTVGFKIQAFITYFFFFTIPFLSYSNLGNIIVSVIRKFMLSDPQLLSKNTGSINYYFHSLIQFVDL